MVAFSGSLQDLVNGSGWHSFLRPSLPALILTSQEYWGLLEVGGGGGGLVRGIVVWWPPPPSEVVGLVSQMYIMDGIFVWQIREKTIGLAISRSW
jgi:hypothetical protein